MFALVLILAPGVVAIVQITYFVCDRYFGANVEIRAAKHVDADVKAHRQGAPVHWQADHGCYVYCETERSGQ